MKTVLIIGAGKSSKVLIDFLLKDAGEKKRRIVLADKDKELARAKIGNHPEGMALRLDIAMPQELQNAIGLADVVVSMLPAFLHPKVAQECVNQHKHFFSASYESEEMRSLAGAVRDKGLLFLNECGLDPGIDHMSAMKIIDKEKSQGNTITLFKSYCGGLLSPLSEGDNPWKYKFTWNPRNVVLAGQGVSRFIRNGRYKFIPYHMLFRRTDLVKFKEVGDFDGYPNRDSLSYRKVYGLEEIPTIIRGTLRRAGFCKSWDVLVQLGMTDNSFTVQLPSDFTMRMFTNTFLPYDPLRTVEEKLHHLLPWISSDVMEKIAWLGLFSNESLPRFHGTPAEILQTILEDKWKLGKEDQDMVVMQHQFEVDLPNGGPKYITSSMVIQGESEEYTAMAKTVGLPLAVAVDLFLDGKMAVSGMHLPTVPAIYEPILKVLDANGIRFEEEEFT